MGQDTNNPQIAETSADTFARLAGGQTPRKRHCAGIAKDGERCTAWALKDGDLCAGHAGLGRKEALEARREAAEARKQARLSVRERAAEALDDDWPDVLQALRDGLKLADRAKAAKIAGDYVALVYGRQLQQKGDEQPSTDELDVGSMTREQRDTLKRRLVSEHPQAAQALGLVATQDVA